jgi:integrase
MRTTKGRVFQRGSTWYVDYQVNGERFKHKLVDRDGNPVKSADGARAELDRLTRPYSAKSEQDRRQLAADALRSSMEVAQAVDIAARPKTPIAKAWDRCPYVRSHRGPVERELSATSITDNRQLWGRFVRWAEVAKVANLEDVTTDHAAAFRESLIVEGLSGHRVNLAIQAARIMVELAGVEPNPFVDLKRRANATKSRRELTLAELTSVCQSATGELQTLLAVGLYCGFRLGDAATLEWGNIALDLSTITRLPGKTAYKGRKLTIPVHPHLRAILASVPRGTGPVMPTLAERYSRDKPGVAGIIRRHFEKAGITTTEVEPGPGRKRRAAVAGFHSLRHCFVSILARGGTPEHTTRGLVGHASSMVHDIYLHSTGDDTRRAVGMLPEFGAVADPEEIHDRDQLIDLARNLPIEAVRKVLAGLKAGNA